MKNTQKLYSQFDLYNELIFDGIVPYCEIDYNNSKDYMGLFYGDYDEDFNKVYRIEISTKFDQHGITLIHEMIHALQFYLDIKVNHGKVFKNWVKLIDNKLGLKC